MSPKHADVGQHKPADEAPIRTAIAWGEHDSAKRHHRAVMWDKHRPIPLRVTADAWPLEVAE